MSLMLITFKLSIFVGKLKNNKIIIYKYKNIIIKFCEPFKN